VFHQTLQRLSGLLNPDGYLCFQLSFPDRFDHLRYDVVPDSNLWNSRWYPDSVASKIITDCGLTILRSQGLGHGAWLTQKAT
jgi:hypothetical protein